MAIASNSHSAEVAVGCISKATALWQIDWHTLLLHLETYSLKLNKHSTTLRLMFCLSFNIHTFKHVIHKGNETTASAIPSIIAL